MQPNIFTPTYSIRNAFGEQTNPSDPFEEIRKNLLTRILTSPRPEPLDASPETLKKFGILDKATLKQQKETNNQARTSEMSDAAVGTTAGIVGGTLLNLLTGNNNSEALLNNALPGISAVKNLAGIQQQEDAQDSKNYSAGVDRFYSSLLGLNKANADTKVKNTELDINTLKALKDGQNDFSGDSIFADDKDLAYTRKINKQNGQVTIEPVMVDGKHLKLRKPSLESFNYRQTADIQNDIDKFEKEYRDNNKLIGQLSDKTTSNDAMKAYIASVTQNNPAMASLFAGKTSADIADQLINSQIDLGRKINELKPKVGQEPFEEYWGKKKAGETEADKRYSVGVVYKDASGAQAKYLGKGKWEEVK